MKTTIVFMGSPRIGGNVEKVNLVDYQKYVCKACGQCKATRNCMQHDKVNELLK